MYHGSIGQTPTSAADLPVLEVGLYDLTITASLYCWEIGLVKASFALTLLPVLRNRIQRWIAIGVLALIIAYSAFYFFFLLFSCAPVAYAWNQVVDPYVILQILGDDPDTMGIKPKGHCVSVTWQKNLLVMYSVVGLIGDVAFGVVLPSIVLYGLQMKRSLKLTAGALLGLGSFAGVATLIRISYSATLTSRKAVFTANKLCLWSNIEFTLCFIGICCATYKPLIRKWTGGTSQGSNPTHGSNGPSQSSNTKSTAGRRHWLRTDGTPGSMDIEQTIDNQDFPLERLGREEGVWDENKSKHWTTVVEKGSLTSMNEFDETKEPTSPQHILTPINKTVDSSHVSHDLEEQGEHGVRRS